MADKILRIILGNQLFPIEEYNSETSRTYFMAESRDLCEHFRYHKHKIILFLANMRHYAEELKKNNCKVHYEPLEDDTQSTFVTKLKKFLQNNSFSHIEIYEIEDKFFELELLELFNSLKIEITQIPSPMFLSSRENFKAYLKSSKRPFMRTFYERERKRFKILVNKGEPEGGKWSFDDENRKALDTSIYIPSLPLINTDKVTQKVIEIVEKNFSTHPGEASAYWMPTNRNEWLSWLDNFIEERLELFGPYQDALSDRDPFLFHSVISPAINMGVITPGEVVSKTIAAYKKKKLPLNSVEGFIRQVIGWREFIRGVYQNFSDKEESTNFWKHENKLTQHWYKGNFGIPPLDEAIQKSIQWGYLHHIERLMIIGNMMTLLEIHPQEAHKWFMELFVDSSDWVMGPNVYGMALFSDGGIFATKPYICGSNYYRKMGKYPTGEWCDVVDGLYWSFIDKHSDFFKKNPRLSMMVRTLDKMDGKRKKLIYSAAKNFKEKINQS